MLLSVVTIPVDSEDWAGLSVCILWLDYLVLT